MPSPPSSPQPDASGQVRIPGPPRIDATTDPNPRVIRSAGREQEQSIRDRKQLLFDEEELPPVLTGSESGTPAVLWKPFREYLRTTPAAPMSNAAKLGIYGSGAVVLLLLLAALLKGG